MLLMLSIALRISLKKKVYLSQFSKGYFLGKTNSYQFSETDGENYEVNGIAYVTVNWLKLDPQKGWSCFYLLQWNPLKYDEKILFVAC